MKRVALNKGRSAQKFRNDVRTTKSANLPRTVMRGGWRL